MNLSNKVAIITGASTGIGAAIAQELSAAGAKLVITARRKQALEELQQALPTECAILAADIGSSDTAEQLLALANKRFGQADILINNAGVMTIAPVEQVDLDAMAKMIQVNFEAVVRSSYTFAKAFKAQGQGAIINVSSLGASLNAPAMGVYGGSKAAVEVFSQSLRVELAGSGVKVGVIAPGSTQTDMYQGLKDAAGSVEGIVALESSDIAAAVRFMLEQPDRSNIPKLHMYPSAEMF